MAKTESPRSRTPGRYESPGRRTNDTRQMEDLAKSISALDIERTKLHILERRRHNDITNLHESALAKEHNVVIEQAAKDRDSLRREAERTLQRIQQQQLEERRRKEEERKRREEEERLRLQREAEQKAERDRKLAEERDRLRKAEEEKARAEEERRQTEAARKVREKEEARLAQEESKRKQDETKKAEEEQQKSQDAQRLAAEQIAQKNAARAATAVSAANTPNTLHQEYISLYFNIKNWSHNFVDELKAAAKAHKNPKIKEEPGETRRLIRTEIGKLSFNDKEVNRKASEELKERLKRLLQQTSPVIGKQLPVNNFLPKSLQLDDNNQTMITDLAAYFLVMLTQQVTKLFATNVHLVPERAEAVGVVVSSIFALPEIQYNRPNPPNPQETRQNLFPIFLAKYHRVCPTLFGVTAPAGHDQTTATGKRALGWTLQASDGDEPKNTFISEQEHYDRMRGYAIGYSSIALRNFSSTSMPNPYPPKNYWKSLAQIVNLPLDKVTPTHICVLRHMFGHGAIGRFLLFFGSVGVAVLREAFVEFPTRLPEALKKDYYVKDLLHWVENVLTEKEHLHLA